VTRRVEPWAARLGTACFDPLEVMDLQTAIRARKKIAVVQGRKFRLQYSGANTVYFTPADDGVFTPSGYLDIKRFLEH
jgi:hypothetical protein